MLSFSLTKGTNVTARGGGGGKGGLAPDLKFLPLSCSCIAYCSSLFSPLEEGGVRGRECLAAERIREQSGVEERREEVEGGYRRRKVSRGRQRKALNHREE